MDGTRMRIDTSSAELQWIGEKLKTLSHTL